MHVAPKSTNIELQAVSLTERATALANAVQQLAPSPQRDAISAQAVGLAMMVHSQEPPWMRDRWRLVVLLTFDPDGPGEEPDRCRLVAEGTRSEMEMLKARIGYWTRLEQVCCGACERRTSVTNTAR